MIIETLERGPETVSRDESHEPFPGPRPFREDEHELFYGRSRETAQLRSMVLASSLVLLYSASGAGKSSLIHAGLVPALRKRGAMVYPVLRIRPTGDEQFESKLTNPYVRAMAGNWAAIADEQQPHSDGQSHAERLKEIADLAGLVRLLAKEYQAPPDRPRVLIVDQFEELFTFLPEHWETRGDVFQQIELAIGADRELSVLISMREDYIAQTDPYAELVSNHLQQRFRIETLREPQALKAVEGPLDGTDRKFAPGAAEALVRELLQIRIDRGRKDRKPDKIAGQYVEPVQLQVVCRRFWEDLPETVKEISEDDVAACANVDEALMRFYNDAVRSAASKDLRARERRIRTWIGNDLITAGETRGTAHRDAAVTKHVAPAALDELVNRHLLKTEWRNGSDWYEITHDRLIDPIRDSNRRYQERIVVRRLRTLAGAAAIMLGLAAATVAALTQQTTTKLVITHTLPGTVIHVGSSSPVPPLIAVPVNGSVYSRGGVFRARYSCVSTAAWFARRCRGTLGQGRPIDARKLGEHRFTVTATYGRSAIITTRNVSYTVVSFASATYRGHLFNVAYPSGWKVENAEARQPGGYTDTTIVAPSNGDTILRVDVTSNPAQKLAAAVDAEVRVVRRQSGYRLLSFKPVRLGGTSALDWQFVVRENGVKVQEEDVFFDGVDDAGNPERFAVLTEAPVRSFRRLGGEFAALRASLTVSSAYYGPNCSQRGLAAELYSMCRLTTGENCPTGFAPRVEADGTDVCLNRKS